MCLFILLSKPSLINCIFYNLYRKTIQLRKQAHWDIICPMQQIERYAMSIERGHLVGRTLRAEGRVSHQAVT